jgi:hypothetical protein
MLRHSTLIRPAAPRSGSPWWLAGLAASTRAEGFARDSVACVRVREGPYDEETIGSMRPWHYFHRVGSGNAAPVEGRTG